MCKQVNLFTYIYSILFILLLFTQNVNAQNIYLKLKGKDTTETTFLKNNITDSIFKTGKELDNELNSLQLKITNKGYLHYKLINNIKTDSVYNISYHLGIKTDSVHVNFGALSHQLNTIISLKKNNKLIAIEDIEVFLNDLIQQISNKGYSISTVKLINHHIKDNILYANLDLKLDTLRKINELVFTPYNNFPTGIKKQLLKKYTNSVFSDQTVSDLENKISQFPFIKSVKQPEVLFTESNTAIYLYVDRQNISQFDGLIGFTNDDNGKVQFNGYADLNLMNVLNKGEQLKLYWKNDGNQQTQFTIATEVPYLFKSKFGIKGALELFKQDSTMMNTKFNGALLYYFDFNHRIGLGYQSTVSVTSESSFYQTADYDNQFVTINYLLNKFQIHPIFLQKYNISTLIGIGNKTEHIHNSKSNQTFAQLTAEYLWQLNNRWYINQKIEGSYLQSATHLLYNELYRFGGVQSIRGFSENSLAAKNLAGLYNEVRYLLAANMYLHTISDVAFYNDEQTDNLLYSFGIGFGLQNGGNLFNLVYANGVQPNSDFKLSNAIFHLSYKARF